MEFFRSIAESQFDAAKMKKNNLFATERMFCDVYCFEPGQSQSGHVHAASDKVYFVIEGTAEIEVGPERRTAGPGTAVLAPAGEPHAVANRSQGRVRLLVFMAPKPV